MLQPNRLLENQRTSTVPHDLEIVERESGLRHWSDTWLCSTAMTFRDALR